MEMGSEDSGDRIFALERRIAALEDEAAIQRLFVHYGLAVDSGDVEAAIALYTEDCHIDIDGVAFMNGRQEARGIVDSDVHQAMLPYCAHVMGPFDIKVEGDRAVAIGYATVFRKSGSGREVWRQSFGRWELVRAGLGWLVARRVARSLGHAEAPRFAAEVLHRTSPDRSL